MQPHFMHNLIHNESSTCHIARVFHQGNKEIEQQNIRQENNDTAHTSDNTIHQKVLQRSFGHVVAYQVAQFAYQPFNPLHRIVAQHKGAFEHQIKEKEENGITPYTVSND